MQVLVEVIRLLLNESKEKQAITKIEQNKINNKSNWEVKKGHTKSVSRVGVSVQHHFKLAIHETCTTVCPVRDYLNKKGEREQRRTTKEKGK